MSLETLKHLSPSTVLDIGAHVGHWAAEAHNIWPKAKIMCIEGNRACEPMLKSSGFDYRIAMLGDSFKTQTYYKQPGTEFGTGNSLYRELTPFFDNCDTEAAQVIPLNALLPDSRWDFIKCDVQGAELDVIRGGYEQFNKAKWVLLEVSIESYNLSAPLWDEVMAFMGSIGFHKRQEIGDIVHPIKRHVVQKDVLFSR